MYLVRPPYLLKKVYSQVYWRKRRTVPKIYLTFDDGPVAEVTPLVLDVLKEHSVKATFFCVGENVVKHPKVYQRILDEGHAVGNHTFNHLKGWDTHSRKFIENVEKCEEVLQLDAIQKKLFRPPYGRAKKTQLNWLTQKGYIVYLWDVLSGDYDLGTSPEQCLKNTTDNVRNGSIIVFHDSIKAQEKVKYALPRFIEYAKEKGFEFAKLD